MRTIISHISQQLLIEKRQLFVVVILIHKNSEYRLFRSVIFGNLVLLRTVKTPRNRV